ncbi:alpha-amylase family glycosyl hydrolase [uncultured Treponema sp.]|uniref:alpha-amylase family glycosyl hydrolase n=1 Tax=uncultured Treponema sp. TaxID=162155 RepID=UPI0025F6D286|nr:alpha-amylase family glycosyl hydrolase [uncultured Treponema sp.]
MKKLMKKIVMIFGTAALLFNFMSCSSGDDDSSSKKDSSSDNTKTTIPVPEGYWRIYLLDKPAAETWQIWAWKRASSGDTNYDTKSWPGGTFVLDKSDSYGSYCDMQLDTTADFGILFVNSAGSPQTNDVIVPKDELLKYNTFYFNFANPKMYYTTYEDSFGIMGANLVSDKEISISTSRIESIDVSQLTVKDSDGNVLEVESATLEKIILKAGNIDKTPYTVSYGNKTISCPITGDVIDNVYGLTDKDFGVTVNGSTASFKMWAPLASDVKLLLFADSSSLTTEDSCVDMTAGTKGIWTLDSVDITGFKYYKYRIANPDKTSDVCDIWAKSCSADSVASQLVDINADASAIYTGSKDSSWGTKDGYYNPFGNNGSEVKSYSDAVIYEMHVRDWSRAFVTDSTGKFLDLANSEEFMAHLKDLGVTHVQILPSFDHAEKNASSAYNWGYNPYHYNVPEGRYVTKNYKDGTQAVLEFRTLIGKLHENGIAVNMDVVYNHTSGTGVASLYDLTVPEYFYRVVDGQYMNGSGCGNEIATNHSVVKTYVIESLKHWMLDYHVNGFRFDLMGCQEAETMKEIYDELYKIDQNVMVYGEPWTGGSSAVVNGATKAGEGTSGIGYGAFDDSFRDAIKGKEFGGFALGHVQGKFADAAIKKGLKGASTNRNDTGKPELSLHYAECHDNYTLFDKLAMSYIGITECKAAIDLFAAVNSYDTEKGKDAGTGLATIKAEDKLAAAYLFLSQGTPFINGGQEFLRTKKGNENSYSSSDVINQIDLTMKDTYADVYNTYKGLIALRKANPAAFGANTTAEAETYKSVKGVTKYTTGDFLVYFNATDTEQTIDTTGYTKLVDVASGTPSESASVPAKVAAKSFVILKK